MAYKQILLFELTQKGIEEESWDSLESAIDWYVDCEREGKPRHLNIVGGIEYAVSIKETDCAPINITDFLIDIRDRVRESQDVHTQIVPEYR